VTEVIADNQRDTQRCRVTSLVLLTLLCVLVHNFYVSVDR